MTIRKIMNVLLGVILVFALSAVGVGFSVSAPRYKGPVTDHFDGNEFHNLPDASGQPVKAKGFREVFGWYLNRERTEPWATYHNDPPGPAPAPRVSGDSLRVTFVNHSTVLLQFDGLNVLTDPVWYERVSPFQFVGPKRNCPPGIRFDDLPKIDILLLSHNHWDHLDIGTVQKIAERDKPKIICPLGVKAFLEQKGCSDVTELDWRQAFMANGSTTIHCVPAQHFSGRGLFDRNATLWAGYVIDSKVAGKLYFAGDSGYGPFFKKINEQFGAFRLSLIPIGAFKPKWFMSPIHISPEEALQVHKDVQSQQSVAIHFGTFPLADDGEREPVEHLERALKTQQIDPAVFQVLRNGESMNVK